MNKSLPIAAFRGEIVAAVAANSVVIITAETGAGKSTQVPQFLLAEGWNLVVTQPRRLATRSIAERVAEERGEELGGIVGFRTAHERNDSAATRCLFATDGLALVRELMGAGRHNLLVLDEVHEWNMNLEVLVSWAKMQIAQGADFKVVLMSATLEAEKLSAFFHGAPIIKVPGRTFPVEEQRPGRSLEEDVANLLRAGRNVLVFQPGKSEIAATIRGLEGQSDLNAEILQLHGELTPEEQRRVFRHFGRPKCVVSTNVAQTSVTIDDIDAVVDSGLERRIELVDGVEGLYLKAVSSADSAQRKGRAGRTKPGIYIDHCRETSRPDFPKAEILRSRLDQVVLRLAEAGFDAEALDFFHQPDKADIHGAKRALKALGCMDEVGKVTPIGRQVSKMPVSVQYARMIVEAERLGVVDDVIDVAAILEQGEITARKIRVGEGTGAYEKDATEVWRKFCPTEEASDVMAQLAVFHGAADMTNDERREAGVFVKAYHQARDKRRHLADALRGKVREFRSSGKREDILRAVCAGMVDHLWRNEYGSYRNGDGQTRELGRESLVRSADWLIGLPFDLEIQARRGRRVLHLIRMATKADPMWLAEVAPQLVRREAGLNPAYDPEKDSVVATTRVFFKDQMVREETVPAPDHSDAPRVFAAWIVNSSF